MTTSQNGRWLVIYRNSYTQTQKAFERYETKEEAERVASEYNRWSQDQRWNCVVAVVQDSMEKLRA